MKCVVLFKKDVLKRTLVLFGKEAARENPLWRRFILGNCCERNCLQRKTLGH